MLMFDTLYIEYLNAIHIQPKIGLSNRQIKFLVVFVIKICEVII